MYPTSLTIRCAENGFILNVSTEKPAMQMSETYYENKDYVFGFDQKDKAIEHISMLLDKATEYFDVREEE